MSMNLVVTKKRVYLTPFAPCLFCIVMLLFLRDYVGISIPAVFFLGLSVLIALFSKKSEVLSFCFCCVPMLNAFQTKYALLICMLIYFARFIRSANMKKSVLPVILLFIWEILHGFVGTFAPVEIIRLFVELAFCAFVMSISSDDIDFDSMSRSVAATTIGVCSIILLSQLKSTGYNVALLFSGIFRFGSGIEEGVMSVGFNPNILSFVCLSAIECLCILIYKGKGKLLDYFAISALTVFGLLTMSKKFIISGVVFIFLFLLCQKNAVKKLKYFTGIIVLSVAVFLILSKVFPSVVDMIVARFNESDITNGRVDIMAFYNTQLASNIGLLLFGVGYYGYAETVFNMFPGVNIPHNGIQELLVMWGVPGLLLFVTFLINMIKNAKKENPNIKLVNYIPLMILLIFCQAAQMVSSTVIMMLLAVSYVCMCENMKERKTV